MASEKFCLRWNDFETNISTAFRELRDDKDFFDVTLACNGDQIQAHKVILSACSPFFRNILRRNPHQHPLLYLKGVKYSDLQSVLNFMYHGEVNVAQEELNSFLSVAEELSVKGLTQNQSSTQNNKSENYSVPKPQIIKPPIPQPSERDQQQPKKPRQVPPAVQNSNQRVDDDIQEVVPVKSEPKDPPPPSQSLPPPPQQQLFSPAQQQGHVLAQADDEQALAYPDDSYEDYGQYGDEQEYHGGMAGMSGLGNHPGAAGAEGAEGNMFQDPTELLQFVRKDPTDAKFYCTLCTHTVYGHKNSYNTRNHVESQHFPKMFSYPCDKCHMTFSTNNAISLHKSRKHKADKATYYPMY